jgi:small subunit ribosomal protein S1
LTFEDAQGGGVAQQEENSMAALLEEETAAYPEIRRGEIIEGTVVGTDRDGILVDIGAKSEGVIPPNEMHCLQPEGPSKLQTGDTVLVSVVQPESHEGQIILSLDRARGERGWRVLQDYLDNNEAFEGYVTGSNKGGLLVNVEGVNAFVPLSQIVAGPERGSPENTQRALAEWVGKGITLKVIELNRRRNRAILSERSAVQEKRAQEKERLLQELQEGDVRTGRITSIRDFGIFVDIGGADGLVHLSELSWERTPKTPGELFSVGQDVPVYVLKVDNEAKKIALSVRRAQPERWEEIVARYREGQIVPGQVTKLAPFGAFVRLEGPIEGLIHISELVDRRIQHPKEVVEEGDVVPVKIVRIEYDRHRLGLSLKQARDKAEQDGWEFSPQGGALNAPPEALASLGLTEMPRRQALGERSAEAEAEAESVAVEAVVEATVAEAVAEEAVEEAVVAQAVAEEAIEQAVVESAEADAAIGAAAEAIVEAAVAEVEAEAAEAAAAEAVAEAQAARAEADAMAEAAVEAVAEAAIEQEEANEAVAVAEEALAEAVAAEVTAEEAVVEAVVAEAEAEIAIDEAEAVEAEVEAEVAAEEITEADVEAETEAEAPAEEVAEAAAETEVAAEAEAALEAEAVADAEEESFEAGAEAATEGAASDVTEESPDAFNKSDEEREQE